MTPRYQVVVGVKLTEGSISLVGPCLLTFGTPEQIAFWLSCGAIEPVTKTPKGGPRGRS